MSLDKALWQVPEKCTGSEGLQHFAPCNSKSIPHFNSTNYLALNVSLSLPELSVRLFLWRWLNETWGERTMSCNWHNITGTCSCKKRRFKQTRNLSNQLLQQWCPPRMLQLAPSVKVRIQPQAVVLSLTSACKRGSLLYLFTEEPTGQEKVRPGESEDQRSYITWRLSGALQLQKIRSEHLLVKTFRSASEQFRVCDVVQVALKGRSDDRNMYVTYYAVPMTCTPLDHQPASRICCSRPHLNGLPLADSWTPEVALGIEMLIGADFSEKQLREGKQQICISHEFERVRSSSTLLCLKCWLIIMSQGRFQQSSNMHWLQETRY